jgi:cell division protein FtsZ
MIEELNIHDQHHEEPVAYKPRIKVIGMGGGGCNAVNRMIELGLSGTEFIAVNTDRQALASSLAPTKIQLGPKVTRGLGAGGHPEIGEAAANESSREIADAMAGADLVFLTAGMGGGTGTGSIPVAAEIARKQGAVTVAVVTTPFGFEMGKRQKSASEGLYKLNRHTDTLIAISNDRLLEMRGGNLTIDLAFRVADDVLRQAIQGVTELITEPGLINVDFANIRRMMKFGGGAFLAIGQGKGDKKAEEAIQKALHHPLVDSISLQHAAGILVNFTGGEDLTLFEVNDALLNLQAQANPQTEIIMGVINDKRMNGRVQAILIVTGLGAQSLEEVLPGAERIQAKPAPAPAPEAMAAEPSDLSELVTSGNIDLPAFLRRGRYSGSSTHSG